jgi:hypothetical protein
MFSSSKKLSIRRLGYLLCVTYILAVVLDTVATLVIIAKFRMCYALFSLICTIALFSKH